MTKSEKENPHMIPNELKVFSTESLVSAGKTKSCIFEFDLKGELIKPPSNGRSWRTHHKGMKKLIEMNRYVLGKKIPRYVMYYDDFPIQTLTNIWSDSQGADNKRYVVQTSDKIIQRCMLMTTNPGDLILDPTCGSGTTAFVAEKFGRRWITCDTSRISINIAKQRLITSLFDYYKLRNEDQGVSGGFEYENVPHVTLAQIANGEAYGAEDLIDKPKIKEKNCRVTGPFTVEATPPPELNPSMNYMRKTKVKTTPVRFRTNGEMLYCTVV